MSPCPNTWFYDVYFSSCESHIPAVTFLRIICWEHTYIQGFVMGATERWATGIESINKTLQKDTPVLDGMDF
jgi:hypothetical protein